jgi:predicted Ser/Thr protein kinase
MGESPALPTIKAGDLLADPRKFADQVQGRIVIVGITSAAALNRESGDYFRTVVSDRYPGAELWGVSIENILAGNVPVSSHWMRMWEFLLAVGLGLGSWFLLVKWGWGGRFEGVFAATTIAILVIQALIDRIFAVQSALDLPLFGLFFGLAGRWIFVETRILPKVYPNDDAKTFIRKNSGESMTKPDMPVTLSERPVTSATEETPEHFGKYKVVGELGRGAMGVVYKGFDEGLSRYLAIKVISSVRRFGEKQSENLNRFQREARAIAMLNHPSIVSIYEAGEWEDNSFIAMEFLDGPTLDGLLRKHRLPWRAVRAWGSQLMEALSYAHTKSVIHRDVKPANIMVVDDGRRVKLTDFGLALQQDSTLTVEGQILGTPYYMAPELIDGKRGDAASDQFALGVVLYEMLSRRRPFEGDNVRQIMLQILMHPAPPLARLTNPEVPAEAIACIDRMMAKKPEERFATLVEAAEAWRLVPG